MTPDPQQLSYAGLFLKMVLACVVVIALAIGALKYVLPFLVRAKRNQKSAIQILDVQSLEHKKAIYIVQIEDKRVAIGVTEQTITKICDL